MSKIAEILGQSTATQGVRWTEQLQEGACPFLQRPCIKTRKSDSTVVIGTCTVRWSAANKPLVICPHRMLEQKKIFWIQFISSQGISQAMTSFWFLSSLFREEALIM